MTPQDENTITRTVRPHWLLPAWLTLWSLVLYLGIVLPFDKLLPSLNSFYCAVPAAALSCVATYGSLRRWQSCGAVSEVERRLQKVTFLSGILLFCFLAVDIGFSSYLNLRQENGKAPDVRANRNIDPQAWDGELMPREYYPTEYNFFFYKPRTSSSGYSYGEFYYPALLQHRVLSESVLQLRQVDYFIDKYGLRNTRRPEEASIFALGDSFCFGYHMPQAAIWTELLQSRLGENVYNMGVSGTSPLQQLLLLQYMITRYPASFKPHHLLWLVFEGNDLSDSYVAKLPAERLWGKLFKGTIVSSLAREPSALREQSLLRRLVDGRMTLNWPLGQQSGPYMLDGARLAYPLYHSARFGYGLFYQPEIEEAAQEESDVLEHRNRPRLDDTFRKMQALSQTKGFKVTVVLVPTAARMYKDDFEDFPPIPSEPHFLNYVKRLCVETGFANVDLSDILKPYASQELLYQRDDAHWNERGHEVVAKLIEENAHLHAR